MAANMGNPDPQVMQDISESRLKTCVYFKYKCIAILILAILSLAQIMYIVFNEVSKNEKMLSIALTLLGKGDHDKEEHEPNPTYIESSFEHI